MNRTHLASLAALVVSGALATVTACSSSSSSGTTPGDDAGTDAATGTDATTDASGGHDTGADTATTTDSAADAPAESSSNDGAVDDGGDGGDGGLALTILNFEDWCSVTVNGGTPTTSAIIVVPVSLGANTLVATPASATFSIGANPWFGVDQNDGGAASGTDNGSGTTETTTAVVTVTGNHCVAVCCEFAHDAGGGGCPAVDTCP